MFVLQRVSPQCYTDPEFDTKSYLLLIIFKAFTPWHSAHVLRHPLELNTRSSLSPLHLQNKSYPQWWNLAGRIHGRNNIVTWVNSADQRCLLSIFRWVWWQKSLSLGLLWASVYIMILKPIKVWYFIPLLANHTEEIHPVWKARLFFRLMTQTKAKQNQEIWMDSF